MSPSGCRDCVESPTGGSGHTYPLATSRIPELDDELHRRLRRRFGAAVDSWLDELPPVLSDLADRWSVDYESLIHRGSVSVVIRCRTADGRPAVMKVSPDVRRIRDEAAALARWTTAHVPAVLAVDHTVGALMIEAIEPGTSLAESATYPHLESIAGLMKSLHEYGLPDPSFDSIAERIDYLYESGSKNYRRRPDLTKRISPELYERGHQLATRLALDHTSTAVLLHGDLTPVNVLDGGEGRGLVAIDPAPCLGDPAFDAIDVVLWRAEDVETITSRAKQLGPAIGAEAERLVEWCAAFAAMAALEIAEASDRPDDCVPLLLAFAEART